MSLAEWGPDSHHADRMNRQVRPTRPTSAGRCTSSEAYVLLRRFHSKSLPPGPETFSARVLGLDRGKNKLRAKSGWHSTLAATPGCEASPEAKAHPSNLPRGSAWLH